MPKILIHNSYSQLAEFPQEVLAQVAKRLTYKDEEVARERVGIFLAIKKALAYKRTRYVTVLKDQLKQLGPEEVCMMDNDGIFPTGLIHIVHKVLAEARFVNFEEFDLRERPEPYNKFLWKKRPHDLRYYQEEARVKGLAHERGVFEMAVGTGKTALACYLIKDLGVNTIFVVPSANLLTQAFDVFTEAFGTSKVMKLETKAIKDGRKLAPIRVATVQTLHSLYKQGLLEKAIEGVDMFIGDEIHHAGSDSYTRLLPAFKNIYYRFGLSGTYLRNDSKTFQLWGVSGSKIYEYGADKATKEGFLTPAKFKIIKLGGRPVPDYQKEYASNYSSLEFLKGVLDVVRKAPPDKQILILVDRKDQCGNLIYKFLNQHGIKSTYMTGDNKKDEVKKALKDFNDKKDRILIGSTVFGEGIDIRSTDILIMARGGKSEIAVTQAIGRAIRLYPGKTEAVIYDFNFRYSRYLTKHTDIRAEIYEKQFAGLVEWL